MNAARMAGLVLVMALNTGATSKGHASFLFLWGEEHRDIAQSYFGVTLNDSSSVNLLNGSDIQSLTANDTSSVVFNGGSVNIFKPHFRSNAEGVTVDLANGSINKLTAGISIEGHDHFVVPQDPTVDLLAPYGLTVGSGTIATMDWGNISVYDNSRLEITEGSFDSLTLKAYDGGSVALGNGSVNGIQITNNASATISGGSVSNLQANLTSSAIINGGSVNFFFAADDSSAYISDGFVNQVYVTGNGSLNIGGGAIGAGGLHATNDSLVTVRGYGFELGSGLSLDGTILTGTGQLSGKWYDTLEWSMPIGTNADTATIFLETFVTGDFNGDGVLSGLDIPGFKAALADPEGWAAANPDRPHPNALGDFSDDSIFSGLDIPGFKTALAGAAVAVPEPAATLLLLSATAVALKRRRS